MSATDPTYRTYKLTRPTRARGRLDYESHLNASQCEAAMALEGPVLVIAGAGTGKTRTLTYRVARLLETGTAADRIVLLTFTRRAAQEMIGRVGRLLGGDCHDIVGGTYHGFASRMLRRHPPEGFTNRFSILDRSDAEDTIQLVRGERGLGPRERRFPKRRTLAEMFSKSVNLGRRLDELIADEYEQFAGYTEIILEIQRAYDAFKARHALMDYDDLLIFLAHQLREDSRAHRDMCSWFRYVMVDEYQDTNRLQAEITDLLVEEHGNLMVVGDDSQSIYAFRGADYRNIVAFPDRYEDARVIKLERNYRSTQEILDVTNAIIAAAEVGFPKRLYTERTGGDLPRVVMTRSGEDEAAFVAQRVLELREEGVPLTDIAVLFRSSFHSYELELELGRRDVPFVKYGGFRFLEAAHVKDVLAHVRVVANPDDAVSWNRLLCLLPGVGPKRAADIQRIVAERGNRFDFKELPYRGGARRALDGLTDLFTAMRASDILPVDMIGLVLAYYEPYLRDRFDDHPRRLTDLEHFQVLTEGYGSLDTMLSDMSLDPPDRSVDNQLASPLDEGEKLTLSTIHSAKGMEWKAVFLVGAVDGQFPSLWSAREVDTLEEERRLMYVATTRAKDELYVVYPVGIFHASSGQVLTQPTRFLADVPDHAVERWAVTP